MQIACSGLWYPWRWFWILQLVRFSRISTCDSRNLLVNGCSFLNISQIFEYCNWGILRTQGIILHFSWSLGFFSLHLLSSVEAKMFEDRRWAEDGSQLPGTWYQKTSFYEAFKESCQKFYQADLEELSFAEATEESRKHINDWVMEKTEGERLSFQERWCYKGRHSQDCPDVTSSVWTLWPCFQ